MLLSNPKQKAIYLRKKDKKLRGRAISANVSEDTHDNSNA